jgi:hypothetical protein
MNTESSFLNRNSSPDHHFNFGSQSPSRSRWSSASSSGGSLGSPGQHQFSSGAAAVASEASHLSGGWSAAAYSPPPPREQEQLQQEIQQLQQQQLQQEIRQQQQQKQSPSLDTTNRWFIHNILALVKLRQANLPSHAM